MEGGDYSAALAYADAALALDESSFDALQLRSRALYLLGKDHEALQTLRRAHEALQQLHPRSLGPDPVADFNLSYVREFPGNGSGIDALETLLALHERYTLDEDLLNLLAELAEDAGRMQVSQGAYRELIALAPDRVDAWEGLIHALCHEDLDAALEVLTAALHRFPIHALFYEFLGFIRFRRRRFRPAITAYRQAIDYGAEQAENYQALVECYLALDEEASALDMVRQLALLGSHEVETQLFIIEVAVQCRQYELAIQQAHQLMRLQPSHAETYCYKAWAEIAMGDWAAAERTLRLGFHKAVDGAFALFELVEIMIADDDLDHAMQVVNLVAELAPDHPESYASRGKVLREKGDLTEALDAFHHAATLVPQDDAYLTWIGVVLDNLGDYQQALAQFDSVLSRQPDDVWTLSNRGLAYLALEMPEEALSDFCLGLSIDSQEAPLYFWRACALVKLGETDRALEDLQRAVDLSDDIFAWLEEEPILLPLRDDPRFRALVDLPDVEEH